MARGRKRNKAPIVIGAVILIVACICGIGYYMFENIFRAAYEKRIGELEEVISINTHTVYVAGSDIYPGQVITGDDISASEVMMSDTVGLFTEADIGRHAVTGISSGEILYSRDFSDLDLSDDTLRNVEYTCFYVPSNIKAGQAIDVRIRFRDGEDFVVLSGKVTVNVDAQSNTCFLDLSELEMQYMASAIIDSKIYDAVMYAVVVEQPNFQTQSEVTYIPAVNTLTVIRDSGITDFEYDEMRAGREKMDTRLRAFYEEMEYVIDTDFPTDQSNVTYDDNKEEANTNGAGDIGNSTYPVEE